MANKRIIELQERTSIDMGDWLIVDSSTSTRKLSLATLFNYMTYTSMIFVTELPTTDISATTIYLVPHSGSTTDWDEYIYRDNDWVLIGTSTIDLSAIYQTKTDNNLQTTSKQIVGAINEVNSDLLTKNDVLINKVHTSSYYMTNMTYDSQNDRYYHEENLSSRFDTISAAIPMVVSLTRDASSKTCVPFAEIDNVNKKVKYGVYNNGCSQVVINCQIFGHKSNG